MRYCLIAILLFQQVGNVADDWVCSQGSIEVKYKQGVNDTERKSFEPAVGLPIHRGPYKRISSQGKAAAEIFHYDVEIGQEPFWLRVLDTNPLVESVEWPRETVASALGGLYI